MNLRTPLAASLVLATSFVAAGRAPAVCFDYGTSSHAVRCFDPAAGQAIARTDTHLFGIFGSELRVYEIDGPEPPVATLTLPSSSPQYAAISGSFLYVSDTSPYRLDIVDVSDPANPQLRGALVGVGGALDADGTLVAIAERLSGLFVIDVSNPDAPTLVGTETTDHAFCVDLVGSIAYVGGDTTFRVIDISVPGAPVEIGEAVTGPPYGYYAPYAIAADGDRVWMAYAYYEQDPYYPSWGGKIGLYDVATPSAPVQVTNIPRACLGLTIAGDFLFARQADGGYLSIDVSTPTAPNETTILGWPAGPAVGDAAGRVWHIGSSGLTEFALTDYSPADWTSSPTGDGGPSSLTTWNDYLVVGTTGYGFDSAVRVYDASPSAPTEIGAANMHSQQVSNVLADGDLAVCDTFLRESGSLTGTRILDLSDPTHPHELMNHFPGRNNSLGSDLEAPFLYGYWEDVPRVTEISPDGAVTPRGTLPVNAVLYRAIGNGLLVASTTSDLAVIDVSDPDAPAQIGSVALAQISDFRVQGTLLYARSALQRKLYVYDFTVPSAPTVLGEVTTFLTGVSCVVGDGVVYCGIEAIDVTDPSEPVVAGELSRSVIAYVNHAPFSFTGGYEIHSFPWTSGWHWISANYPQCISAVDAPDVAVLAPTLAPPFPNPFRASTALRFGLTRAGSASLSVFDAAGRRVRSLGESSLTAGEHELVWDGRDAAGRPVAAGVYFLRLATPEREDVQRVVRLR
ncbi:MAG: T9SS type A sorting domain-containing protein [Gemmatimonadetes bacterium]|nr:T9SS type A sorting domain-containing protein [Gemmatimonadota bacterium]